MAIENTRQIVRELLLQTESNEIKWINIFENSEKLVFRYIKKITERKSLSFEISLKRSKSESDLTIKFGPVGDNTIETFIYFINVKTQPLLYDLLDLIGRKFDNGDIKYKAK